MSLKYSSFRTIISKIVRFSRILALIYLFTFMLPRCKKFVTVDPPVTNIVTSEVFNDASTATSAMLNIYQKMYTNNVSYVMALSNGLLSDEFSYSGGGLNLQYYMNSMNALSGTFGPWSGAYNYIYQANVIIENLSAGSLDPRIRRQLIGEAEFLRAFWYFYLVNFYGDVPLVTSSNYSINRALARAPQEQVYQRIIGDLRDADQLLNSGFVDGSDTTVYPTGSEVRVRPTTSASRALLARVFLFHHDFDSAAARASQVISNPLFGIVGLDSVFLANSKEAIWQLATPLTNGSNGGANTLDGQAFILTAAGSTVMSPRLMSSFDSGDARLTHWISSVTAGAPSVTYYFPYKYKVRVAPSTTANLEYTMVLRLAEQYLIRAEARAQLGDVSGSQSDLNTIRYRANLGATSAGDKDALLKAIFHERQVELFTEWGHRWMDMVRTGSTDSIMGPPGNACQAKGGIWSSDWKLYPIAQSERNNDPNLSQNAGY